MTAMRHTIDHWGHVASYVYVPSNEKEYNNLMEFMNSLMEWLRHHKDDRATSLLRVIANNIHEYENKKYPSKKLLPVDMLKFLMDEHGLSQNDLPEIGSQSLISKILNGERKLTLEHIHYLSEHFGVSPIVFI